MTGYTREYGVRYWFTGAPADILLCDRPGDVPEVVAELTRDGYVNIEPVTRVVPDWDVDAGQLPAALRALAVSHAGGQATYTQVKNRLAALLRVDPTIVLGRWRRLLTAVEAWRRAQACQNAEDEADRAVDEAARSLIERARVVHQ